MKFPRDGRPQITIKLGRQTAERRITECRVQNTKHGRLVGSGLSKTKLKATIRW